MGVVDHEHCAPAGHVLSTLDPGQPTGKHRQGGEIPFLDAGHQQTDTPLDRVHRCDVEWFGVCAIERVDLLSQTADESTGESSSIVVVDVECADTYSLLETHYIDALRQPRCERTRLGRIPARADHASATATLVKDLQPGVHKGNILAALSCVSGYAITGLWRVYKFAMAATDHPSGTSEPYMHLQSTQLRG